MTTIERRFIEAIGDARGILAADRLCLACVGLLDVDAAAISLVFDGTNVGTLGASGADARSYDEVQFTVGEGPCLDSVARRVPIVIGDLSNAAERRWPAYVSAMISHRIRGVCAVPVIVAGQYVGALDLFCGRPLIVDDDHAAAMAVAAQLASLPVLDLLGADLRAAIADPYSDAWAELTALSRTEVSQATGMLMAQLNIESAAALARLRAHAYATNRSATAIAREVINRELHLERD